MCVGVGGWGGGRDASFHVKRSVLPVKVEERLLFPTPKSKKEKKRKEKSTIADGVVSANKDRRRFKNGVSLTSNRGAADVKSAVPHCLCASLLSADCLHAFTTVLGSV